MTEKFRITLTESADSGLLSVISESGAVREQGDRNWVVPEESIQELMAKLWSREVDFRVARIVNADSERPEDRAGYLGLFREEEASKLGAGPLLAYDLPRIELPLANQELIDTLTSLAPELVWEPSEKPGRWRLAHAPALPEPLKIKELYDKIQGDNGLWLLTTDGDNYLTERNLDFLRTAGVVQCGLTQHGTDIYPTLPVPIYSGRVIDVLMERGVRFAAPPLYLRREIKEDL
ncbi:MULTISPECIES: hypothetical protein [Streptomyces]|uniref:hypothetical protein n=1 Tax=Streptomyces TaxID=1883 RepID=UPI0015FBFD3D|nr:hypothetical protein [Streptomyces sp. GMR22]MBA6441690.1 hypothetical protein [Streptomyces sp. GMR22]